MKSDTNSELHPPIDVQVEKLPTTSEVTSKTATLATVAPPKTGMQAAIEHYGTLVQFVKTVLQKEVDWGYIKGCEKPMLFKPGAEKIAKLFGLKHRIELISKIEDYTGQSVGLDFPLFSFHYKCQLINQAGEVEAEGEGICSSAEWKYRKQGANGIFNSINTICKLAQKRAMVGAVLIGCGASEFFSCDLEDLANPTEEKPKQSDRKDELIQQVYAIKEQLNWSKTVAIAFAQKTVGKRSTSEMSIAQIETLIGAMLQELSKIGSQKAS